MECQPCNTAHPARVLPAVPEPAGLMLKSPTAELLMHARPEHDLACGKLPGEGTGW